MNATTKAALIAAAFMLGGCTSGLLQTARTTPKDHVDVTLGQGFLYNEMVADRGIALPNLPPQLMVRVGVHERVDVGVRHILGDGIQLDAKVNLMDPGDKLAVSLSLGVGAAGYLLSFDQEDVVSVTMPLNLIVSYDIDWFTPYLGIGYHTWWHVGYEPPGGVPEGAKLAAREGHGDGMLAIHVGGEIRINKNLAFMLEYGAWASVLDDPGDNFAMTTSHMVFVGLRI